MNDGWVEGNNRPEEISNPKFEFFNGKISDLLQMLSLYFSPGRNVALDLGFCVMKELVDLRNRDFCKNIH